jgi:hypothetical protein
MKRFRGGGVGHASTRKATDFFKQDRDSRDTKRVLDEDNEDYGQTQCEATVPNWTRAERDDEEEDYGYNRGQFSDMDEEEEEEECSDDEFGPEDDGGEVNELIDNLGYGEM